MRARIRTALGICVVLVLGIVTFAVPRWLPKSAEQNCYDALRERRNQDAVTECTRAFEAEPKGEIAASLASAYSSLNRVDEAWTWANRPEAADQLRAKRVRAQVLVRRGEIANGRTLIEEVLRVAIEREDAGEAARAAHVLAGIHWDRGRYTAAYDAIDICEREARRADDGAMLAMAELARGDIFSQLGDSHRAEVSFRRAIEATAQWPREQGYAVLKLGLAHRNRSSPRRAEELFRRARNLGETSADRALLFAARHNLVEVLSELGRHDEAAAEFESLWKDGGAGPSWTQSRTRARLALGRGEAEAALRALDEISPVPTNEKVQLALLRLRADALVLAGRSDEAEAVWSEAIRLVEVLSTREPEQQGWVASGRREPFDALFVHLVRKGDHRGAWEVVTRYARAEALALEPADVTEDPRSFLAAAESARSSWRSLPLEETAGFELEAARFRELLVLHEAGDRLWAGLRRRDQVQFVDLGATSELDSHLRALTGDPGQVEAAEKLGTTIWRGARLSSSNAPLHVRATGRLNRLAFAALRVEGRYWIELRPIARVPALTSLAAAPRAFNEAPLIAGDPEGDLPAAREELTWLEAFLPVSALQGGAATRDAVLSSQRRPLLHLATHARVDLEGARLVLADGEVTPHDILEARPNAWLVVLASCASGTGREAAGSDSLSAAFLRAGSGAVVATLRSVPDSAMQKLMRAFYEAGALEDPATALARAQRSLIGDEPPEVWSAFVLSLGPTFTAQPGRGVQARR